MKSRTKKSRKHTRRSAVASLLVLSSCLGAAQAYAANIDPNTQSADSGNITISAKTVTVSDGATYGSVRGSAATISGSGTAITGGNEVTLSNSTNGACRLGINCK